MPDAPPAAAPVRLIDNWKARFSKLWSIRIAIGGIVFWGALSGLWVLWPAFVDWLPLWFYAIGGVLMSIALAFARVLKQPGVSE
jgi:hypothetical protein